MSELKWDETTRYQVWLAEVPNALVLTRQTFLNKDGSRGELYLISNDLGRCAVATSAAHLPDKYGLGWTVEAFYKSIQSNTGYAHWPAHRVRTHGNHLFLVMRGRPCGGLCDVSSGERSYSVELFCVEGPTAIKGVKNSVGAEEGPQASLSHTCSMCVTSVR